MTCTLLTTNKNTIELTLTLVDDLVLWFEKVLSFQFTSAGVIRQIITDSCVSGNIIMLRNWKQLPPLFYLGLRCRFVMWYKIVGNLNFNLFIVYALVFTTETCYICEWGKIIYFNLDAASHREAIYRKKKRMISKRLRKGAKNQWCDLPHSHKKNNQNKINRNKKKKLKSKKLTSGHLEI